MEPCAPPRRHEEGRVEQRRDDAGRFARAAAMFRRDLRERDVDDIGGGCCRRHRRPDLVARLLPRGEERRAGRRLRGRCRRPLPVATQHPHSPLFAAFEACEHALQLGAPPAHLGERPVEAREHREQLHRDDGGSRQRREMLDDGLVRQRDPRHPVEILQRASSGPGPYLIERHLRMDEPQPVGQLRRHARVSRRGRPRGARAVDGFRALCTRQ